jgi:hypothetical protein
MMSVSFTFSNAEKLFSSLYFRLNTFINFMDVFKRGKMLRYINLIRAAFVYLSLLGFGLYAQSFTQQMNNIAANHDFMDASAVVFCDQQITESYYFGKSDFQRNLNVDAQAFKIVTGLGTPGFVYLFK